MLGKDLAIELSEVRHGFNVWRWAETAHWTSYSILCNGNIIVTTPGIVMLMTTSELRSFPFNYERRLPRFGLEYAFTDDISASGASMASTGGPSISCRVFCSSSSHMRLPSCTHSTPI